MSTFRFVAFGLGLAAISAACSSTAAAPEPTPTPKPVCPNTVMAATDPKTSCEPEGYICGIGFPCGAYAQQATCTCTNKVWVCNDAANPPAQIMTGEDPSTHCVPQGPGAEKCPTDVASVATSMMPPVDCTNSKKYKDPPCCTNAGQACYYKGTLCASGAQLTDVCTCEGVGSFDGGTPYLSWVCNVATCH